MIIKYLEGSITVKGLYLPNAIVRCIAVQGSELDGTWSCSIGVYGNINSAMSKTHHWLDIYNIVIMMDGYQPNNVENHVNIFEYSLVKLKQVENKFSDFELKSHAHTLVFTNAITSSVLIDPVLITMNPHGVA